MSDSSWQPKEDIYEQIKARLTELSKDKIVSHRDSMFPRKDSIPGPGQYHLTSIFQRSEPVRPTFNKARRFRYNRPLATENPDVTRPNASLEMSSSQSILTTEPNMSRTEKSDRSINIFRTPQTLGIKRSISTPRLRGSFSKASRNCKFALDSPSAGPAMYNVTASQSTVSFSFGSKCNEVSHHATDIPGPGAYKPENFKGESNHLGSRSAVILKAQRDYVKDLPGVNNPPDGPNYYLHNHYTSFDTSKKRGVPIGTSNRTDFINKFHRIVPGPGMYPIQNSPLYSNVSQSIHEKEKRADFPSFGRPNYKSPVREVLPGPSDYDPLPAKTSPSTKIGTSKRPDLFSRKKIDESHASEQKAKRLSRLELRVADIAILAEAKALSKHPCPPARARKLFFEELAERNETPGLIYNLAKYHQLGKNVGGGVIARSEFDPSVKEMEEKMYIPGPATYDVSRDPTKVSFEPTFGHSERQDLFVKKDAALLPGVGEYNTDYVMSPPKGGVIPRAQKTQTDRKAEMTWDRKQENHNIDPTYRFLFELSDRVNELIKKEKRRYGSNKR